jgi:hypothetical protein
MSGPSCLTWPCETRSQQLDSGTLAAAIAGLYVSEPSATAENQPPPLKPAPHCGPQSRPDKIVASMRA